MFYELRIKCCDRPLAEEGRDTSVTVVTYRGLRSSDQRVRGWSLVEWWTYKRGHPYVCNVENLIYNSNIPREEVLSEAGILK